MRQIEMLVQFVARLLFHKDYISYTLSDETSETGLDALFQELCRLLRNKKFCDAEDLLFARIDETDPRYLVLAVDFYERLNACSDEDLEHNQFPREEILDGLNAVLRRFGITAGDEVAGDL